MSNLRTKKFVPLAKHPFDLAAIHKTQQAVNAMLNSRIVVGNERVGRIHNSDSNQVIEVPSQSLESMFPFKIYNIKNASASAEQRSIYSDAGLNIDNYTFQVRGGVVSVRQDESLYPVYGNSETYSTCMCTDIPPDGGYIDYSSWDYQPTPNSGSCIYVPDSSHVAITLEPTKGTQVIIAPPPSDSNTRFAFFWLEGANLKCHMADFWGTDWFPEGIGIVPLGYCGVSFGSKSVSTYKTFCHQVQWGNLVNRYTDDSSTYRGFWSDIKGLFNDIIAYNGDIVVEDTNVLTAGGINYINTYVYTGHASQTGPPSTVPSKWKIIGSQILP